MIELRCPACKHSIKLDDSFTGRRISCVGCGKEFVVPDAKQRAATKSGPAIRSQSTAPAMSVAKPANQQQTLLDTAKRYRELIVGGVIVGVLAVAAFVMYTAMPGGNNNDDNDLIVATSGGDGSQSDGNNAATDAEHDLPATDGLREERSTGNDPSNANTQADRGNSNTTTKRTVPTTSNSGKPKTGSTKTPQVEQPAEQQIASARYSSTTGILLRESAELNDWLAVTHDTEIPAGTQIALPAPFAARFEVGRKLYSVRLLGGSMSRLLEASDELPFGFELQRGRLIFEGQRESDVPGAVFSLAVRDERWRVELLAGNTVLGVEVFPRRPDRFEQDFGDDVFRGGILVVKGSVRVTDDAGRTRVVAGNSWLSLARRDRVDAKFTEADQSKRRLPEPQYRALPDWLDLDKLAASPKTNPDAELFEGTFNRQQEFTEAIEPLLASTDKRAVTLAVECLAMLGRRATLINALAETKHAEVRQAAVDGLREQMPSSKTERRKLKQELAEAFGKGSDAIYALLWGYADEDVRKNQFTCFQLIDWLMDEELVIRELAWAQITAHATARYAYKPNAPLRSRRLTAMKWQQHVLKTGSILGEEL